MNTFYVKSVIVRDGFFGGPMWKWLPELGTQQPKEGWVLLPPELPIWRDEMAYVVKTPWEELPEVLFERWNVMTRTRRIDALIRSSAGENGRRGC